MIEVLAKRFDLQTGACLDESIRAEDMPRVTVQKPNETSAPVSVGANVARLTPLTPGDAAGVAAIAPDNDAGIERLAELPDRAGENTIRTVLAQWDLTDLNGWREPLTASGANSAGWAQFANSELCGEVARAAQSFRAVDYVWSPPTGPVQRGVIDLLWQDTRGWHVAGIAKDAEDANKHDYRDELLRQAAAVQERFGKPVVDVRLYAWHSGKIEACDA
jgi:hypothetical protein